VVIADEPTGSLDRANADAVAGLLISTTRARGAALLVATHDPAVARTCDAVFELGDGSLRPIQMAPC
jgi:predicted ABC-type transport system involved in lysophospholipase L1 biosynthesis ATPase subunit